MGFDLIKATGNQLPDFIRKIGYVDSGLGAGIAPKAPRLGMTTGKEFTWTDNGQTQVLEERKVRAIIVAAAENIQKAWYEKAYQPGQVESPDCFSLDGKVPAPTARKPQCSNCAVCKKNAFGSASTGRGKACSDHKQIVLAWENHPDKLATMKIPTMSLQSLKKIDTAMKEANIPLQAVLCELKFNPQYTYPVLDIGAVGFVDEVTATRLLAASTSEEVRQLLREVEMDDEGAAEAQKEPVVPSKTVQFGTNNQVEETAPAAEPLIEPAASKRRGRPRKPKETALEAAKDIAAGGGVEPEVVEYMATDAELAEAELAEAEMTAPSNVMDLLAKWGNK